MTTQPDGFLSMPASQNGRAVLVLHPWWGLNQTIKDYCARLSQAGFAVFAPDLYHGKVVATIPEAEAAVKAINANPAQAEAEVSAGAAFLAARAGVADGDMAVVGFSLGAYFALELSNKDPDRIHRVVVYYGTGAEDFSASEAAYLGHFAENDPFEPRPGVDALEATLKQAGRPVTFHHYAGTGHWFAEPDRADAYNKAAANLAWERTLAFLKQP